VRQKAARKLKIMGSLVAMARGFSPEVELYGAK
jgi:hypothetical protein